MHIYTDDIDHSALQQLLDIASLPVGFAQYDGTGCAVRRMHASGGL